MTLTYLVLIFCGTFTGLTTGWREFVIDSPATDSGTKEHMKNSFLSRLALSGLMALILLSPSLMRAGTITPPDPASICNLVANCGFETGDFTDWTITGDDTFSFVESSGDTGYPAHSGNFFALLGPVDADSFLSQSLTTVAGHPLHFAVVPVERWRNSQRFRRRGQWDDPVQYD
jgi:hypothetical protein